MPNSEQNRNGKVQLLALLATTGPMCGEKPHSFLSFGYAEQSLYRSLAELSLQSRHVRLDA